MANLDILPPSLAIFPGLLHTHSQFWTNSSILRLLINAFCLGGSLDLPESWIMQLYLKWNNHLQNVCLFWITEMPARLQKPVWCGLLSVCCSSGGISCPGNKALLAGTGWSRQPKGWKQWWWNVKGKPISVLVNELLKVEKERKIQWNPSVELTTLRCPLSFHRPP